jgi:CRP-like cAMP-binding protein
VHFDSTAFVADPELVSALEERSMPVPCDTDRILFHQGDPALGLFILHRGSAMLTMSEGGKQILTVETTSGSLLGLPGIIGNEPYTLTATAAKGAQVSFMSREKFTELMHSDPRLSLKILKVLAAEVRSARSALH